MKMVKQQILISSFFIALILLSFSCLSKCDEEVDDEGEFTYELDSERGPDHWGEIKVEWRMCNSGGMQSPIDLMDERVETVSDSGRLNRDYKPSNATLTNRGHDMVLRWASGAGYIEINGTQFVLKQCHWHSPSEHSINGKRFDMELHLVHESAEGRAAVVALMYKIGQPDSFLKMIENYLESLAETLEVEREVGVVSPLQIEIGSSNYYRYIGSLTVPPCSPNVVWTIVRKVRTVTREQVELIRDAVHDESETNARPIQPVNQRSVKLFGPEDQQEN
ncbi:hypothetical protein LguiB_001032 [Lonicera macranthoides]